MISPLKSFSYRQNPKVHFYNGKMGGVDMLTKYNLSEVFKMDLCVDSGLCTSQCQWLSGYQHFAKIVSVTFFELDDALNPFSEFFFYSK